MAGEAAPTHKLTIADLAASPPGDDAYLVDGELFHVEAATPNHERIAANLTIAVGVGLRGGPCAVFGSHFKVHVARKSGYVLPDLTVVCGPLDPHPDDGTITRNPQVIFEVLSKTTEDYDRSGKLVAYREITSLTDYVLVAQDRARVEQHTRQGDGTWLVRLLNGTGELVIASIDARVSLDEIYEGVTFVE